MANCKECEVLQRAGISDICPSCIRKNILKTMPYLGAVLEEMTPKYNIRLDESLFDILHRMEDEDREKLKEAIKYPMGKLRVIH